MRSRRRWPVTVRARTYRLQAVSFSLLLLPPRSTLFPYTTLFRSVTRLSERPEVARAGLLDGAHHLDLAIQKDRKSTRLNSSHTVISYAVFCLKKKKRVESILNKINARARRVALIVFLIAISSNPP